MDLLPPEFTFIERGWLNCNSTLVHAGDAPAIIDTGHVSCAAQTVERVRKAGIEPEQLGRIVLTHAHSDHHGANRALKNLSGAPVLMGALTAEWFARDERRLTWFDQLSQEADIVPADMTVADGDTVEFGGLVFEVVSLPGHGPDTVGYFQPDTKVMICADSMWQNDTGMLHPQIHGWEIIEHAEYALGQLRQLDIAVAIPGHGGLITDVPDNIDTALQRLESFRQTPAKLAWHIIRRFYVYGVLRYQPIAHSDYHTQILADGWIDYYCSVINAGQSSVVTPQQLLERLKDQFVERGVVVEQHGWLTSELRV